MSDNTQKSRKKETPKVVASTTAPSNVVTTEKVDSTPVVAVVDKNAGKVKVKFVRNHVFNIGVVQHSYKRNQIGMIDKFTSMQLVNRGIAVVI